MNNEFPSVICICPTFNRFTYLVKLIYMFYKFDYPKDKLKLIILDDSNNYTNDEIILLDKLLKSFDNIIYKYSNEKLALGKKRNILNFLALDLNPDYIVCLDDDDYYCEDKIKYTITEMIKHNSILSGSSKIYVYYSNIDKIYSFGPYNDNHSTNGVFTYHKSFLETENGMRLYNNDANNAEERQFLDGYKYPILQLDPLKTILCISHKNNTVNKNNFLSTGNLTDIKIKDIVKDEILLNFYKNINTSYLIIQYDNRILNNDFKQLININKAYCKKFNYDHIYLYDKFKLSPYWVKVYLVNYFLKFGKYRGILWLDTDATIHNLDIKLDDLLIDNKSFYGAPDNKVWDSPFNSGVFLVLNNDIGKSIMKDWLNLYDANKWYIEDDKWKTLDKWANGEAYEQGAFCINILPKYKDDIHLFESSYLQSFYSDILKDNTLKPFTLHFAGGYKKEIPFYLSSTKL